MRRLISLLEDNPIIAAIKDDKGLGKVVDSRCNVVYVLYGDICNIGSIVERIKEAGKIVIVNVDLLDGTSNKEIVIDFIRNSTRADGIISSKPSMVRAANERGFYTIHRMFLIDSMSLHNVPKQHIQSKAQIVDVVPGSMPKVLGWVQELVHVPIIASGLVCDKEDVVNALKAGALAVSSTNPMVWDHI